MATSIDSEAQRGGARSAVTRLIVEHKAATSAAVLVATVLVAFLIAVAFSSSKAAPLSDATPCSGWADASSTEQLAYAQLYLKEHAALLSGSGEANRIDGLVTDNCSRAALLGEADEVTVLAAIEQHF